MEPANLNSPSPDDARLDAWLQRDAAIAPLPDDGFSARVLAALPPPTRSRPSWRRPLVGLAGAVAGLAVAGGHGVEWAQVRAQSTLLTEALFGWLAEPWGLLVLTIIALSLVVAFLPDLSRHEPGD